MLPETIEYALARNRMLLSLIRLRKDTYEREHEEAVAGHRWSQVAGLHGIGTGLIMAENLLLEEQRDLERYLKAAKHAVESNK